MVEKYSTCTYLVVMYVLSCKGDKIEIYEEVTCLQCLLIIWFHLMSTYLGIHSLNSVKALITARF